MDMEESSYRGALPRGALPRAGTLDVSMSATTLRSFASSTRFQRQGTANSLLRSRRSEAQQYPVGPLRKLLREAMNDHHKSMASEVAVSWLEWTHKKAALVVSSRCFEFLTGIIILANMVTIAVDTQQSLSFAADPDAFWPGGVERIFLALYCIEAFIRILAGGWSIFLDVWLLLDICLIILGVISLFLAPQLDVEDSSWGISFEKLLVVRGLRLFRLVRVLRMLSNFKLVWRLVYSLFAAGQTILSTTILISVSLFLAANVAVELIAKDPDLQNNPATAAVVDQRFFGLGKCFVTFIQFATLDDISEVYYPLIMEKPYLAAFFLPMLLFISIGLMNLVTATLVENAMKTAAMEAEEERLKLKKKIKGALPSLIEIFHELDVDESGLITYDEVENVPATILPPRVLDGLNVESMADIFFYLDVDGSGQLTQMEFVEGLLNLCLLDMPISTIQILKSLQLLRAGVDRLELKAGRMASQSERQKQQFRTLYNQVLGQFPEEDDDLVCI